MSEGRGVSALFARAVAAIFLLSALWAQALAAPMAQDARPLVIATWNLAWLVDRPTFERWQQHCAQPSTAPDEQTQSLPPCDAYSGMVYPLAPCLRVHDASQKDRHSADFAADHPCRQSRALRQWEDYEEKLAALRVTAKQLEARQVELVFLQEVHDRAAAAQIFSPDAGWRIVTSAELADAPKIAQHVGLAYRGRVALARAPELLRALALEGVADHALRPGLAATVLVQGHEIDFLALHLKSGCRQELIDAPRTRRRSGESTANFQRRTHTKRQACAALRAQIPALESWVDARAQAGRWFALVGDFNRDLFRDGFRPERARLSDSDQRDPSTPITSATRIARLMPELSDDAPRGARLYVARTDDRELDKVELCKSATRSIDHFVFGQALTQALGGVENLRASVLGYGAQAYGRTLALPSDHCPRVLALPLPRKK